MGRTLRPPRVRDVAELSLVRRSRFWQYVTPMPFSLSFSDDFFFSPEPPENVEPSSRPTSVYQALLSLRDETWQEIAREVFGIDPDFLDIEAVMGKIRQTNTCTGLTSPVEVWIDHEGWYRVEVYDASE